MTLSPAPNSINALFPGNGEMAACCRKVDWSATSLGSVDGWEPALRHALRTTMECPFAICLWCGPEKILIYNDAYTPLLGAKHPRALGRPGAEVWAEAWSDIGPVFEVMEQGNPVYAEDGHFVMERSGGIAADAWFTYSLSPVRAESGVVVAYLNVASETTARVHAERDLRAARKTAERAEGRLRDVFAQAPGFLAVLNGPDHVSEFVTSSYLQLVGHRELIGRRVIEALPELVSHGIRRAARRRLSQWEAVHWSRASDKPPTLAGCAARRAAPRFRVSAAHESRRVRRWCRRTWLRRDRCSARAPRNRALPPG